MNSGIYMILNSINGNRYIGSSINLDRRWRIHLQYLRRGSHHCRYLQNAFLKYGETVFEFRPLILCDENNLLIYEQLILDGLHPEYNILRKAGSVLGLRYTPEQCDQRSRQRKGNPQFRGHHPTLEQRALLSKRMKGNRNRLGHRKFRCDLFEGPLWSYFLELLEKMME